jgi:hypothetical protein
VHRSVPPADLHALQDVVVGRRLLRKVWLGHYSEFSLPRKGASQRHRAVQNAAAAIAG